MQFWVSTLIMMELWSPILVLIGYKKKKKGNLVLFPALWFFTQTFHQDVLMSILWVGRVHMRSQHDQWTLIQTN